MRKIFLYLFSLLCVLTPSVFAEFQAGDAAAFLDEWHIAGENSVYLTYFDSHGRDAATRYTFDGFQAYSEHQLSMDRKLSDYETLSASISNVINSDEYRNAQQGWYVEDLRFEWEKGDGFVPFRVNAGDYTATLTYRTIQRSLKGFQVEVQPDVQIGDLEQRHSAIVFTGISTPIYRDVQVDRDLFSGFSWLTDLQNLGAFAFNLVHNFRDNDPAAITRQRNQLVWGFTYENQIEVLTEKLSFEAEVNKFIGDYDSFLNTSGVEEDVDDTAVYFAINGSSTIPLTYGFRFENYGDHFQPHGAVISPNRRTLAWDAGWAFENGMSLDGRIELYRDNLESDNHINTKTYGLSLSGPVSASPLENTTIYADIYRQSVNDTLRFANTHTWGYTLDTRATLYEQWSGHAGFNSTNTADGFRSTKYIPREFNFDVSHPISFSEAQGSARAGMVFRSTSGSTTASDQFVPTFGMNLSKDSHRFNFNTGVVVYDSHARRSQNTVNFTFKGGYGFEHGPHRLSADFKIDGRNPNAVKPTQDYRFGLTYTFSFDKPAGTNLTDFDWSSGYSVPSSRMEAAVFERAVSGMYWYEAAAPGSELSLALSALDQLGITGATDQSGVYIFENRVFEDVKRRQRVVLESEEERVVRASVIIDLNAKGDADSVHQVYAKLQKSLLESYGNPSLNREEGDFAESYVEDVNNGALIRITEWKTNRGIIRLGIPQRRDNRVRIEVQRAMSFPSARDAYWSLESIV